MMCIAALVAHPSGCGMSFSSVRLADFSFVAPRDHHYFRQRKTRDFTFVRASYRTRLAVWILLVTRIAEDPFRDDDRAASETTSKGCVPLSACTARGGCEKGLRQITPGARRWVGGPRFGVCISTGGRTTLEGRAVMCTMLLVMLRTAIENRAVDIAHHRADVPRRVARARLAGARLEVLYVPAPQTRGAWGGGGREGAFRRCLSHF